MGNQTRCSASDHKSITLSNRTTLRTLLMKPAEMVSRNPSSSPMVPKQAKPHVIYFRFLVTDILRQLSVLTQAGRVTNLHAVLSTSMAGVFPSQGMERIGKFPDSYTCAARTVLSLQTKGNTETHGPAPPSALPHFGLRKVKHLVSLRWELSHSQPHSFPGDLETWRPGDLKIFLSGGKPRVIAVSWQTRSKASSQRVVTSPVHLIHLHDLPAAQSSHHLVEASPMGLQEPVGVVGGLTPPTSSRQAAPVTPQLASSLLP